MMESQAGYDVLTQNEKFQITFGMRSTGATNMKTLVESTKC